MADEHTTVSDEGWLSRMGKAIGGIIVGIALFVIAFPVLFFNEGRSVDRIKALEEGAGSVVSISADKIDSKNEGKLVHLTGELSADSKVSDPEFNVVAEGLSLKRTVEMYQWVEEKEEKKEKKMGGGERTITKYKYHTEWSDDAIDSSAFEVTEDHENPGSWTIETKTFSAEGPKLGAFDMTPPVAALLDDHESLTLTDDVNLAALGEDAQRRGDVITNETGGAEVGDLRVKFTFAPLGKASVVAGQTGQALEPRVMSNGEDIAIAERGVAGSARLFKKAEDENTMMTWLLRAVGLAMMFGGVVLVLKPISVVMDVVPFIGNVAEMGIMLVAGLVTATFGLLTIALAWVFFRPLIGIPLLAAGLGLAWYLRKKSKESATPAAA